MRFSGDVKSDELIRTDLDGRPILVDALLEDVRFALDPLEDSGEAYAWPRRPKPIDPDVHEFVQ